MNKNVLELFCGTCSFSNVAKEFNLNTFTVDFDRRFNPDLCIDILDIEIDWLCYFLNKNNTYPEIVWASPPCTTFSVASIGKHWNKDNTPKTKEAEIGLNILKKTIQLINKLNPKYFFIENPRGKMRKVIQWLPNGTIRNTVTYCQYGDKRMKPTDIWTNCIKWNPKPICKNGSPCHEKAPRGSKTGTQGIEKTEDRSRVPYLLCKEILESILN